MKPRLMPAMERCIEDGITLGWNRAHKHTDTPTEAQIKASIEDAIWEELHQWFEFELPGEQSQD
jgi:hypothetical protein